MILYWFVSWNLILCSFAGFPHCRILPKSAEFCRILSKFRIPASSRTIGASVVLYNNGIHDKFTIVNRKPEH